MDTNGDTLLWTETENHFTFNIDNSEEELHNAKNNLIGKQQFLFETNSQQANTMAYYSIFGKGFDYREKIIEQVKNVTSDDILACANKFFTEDYVLAVIKP